LAADLLDRGTSIASNRWKPSIQQDEEQAIADRELDATADLALQRNQLMSEGGILSR
jgi:hypothetical protein